MSRRLPAQPNLEHLKKQAKVLHRGLVERDPAALKRFRAAVEKAAPARPRLSDAQRAIAREYGFTSWARLKAHVESVGQEPDPVAALGRAVESNDAAAVKRVLTRHPSLEKTLDGPLPNLPFGGTALISAVNDANREMIDVLLEAGADINRGSHWWAGSFGVLDSCDPELARFLIERGATVTPHAAARLGMKSRLAELVSTDPAVVHARGGDGQTPLHFAANIEIAGYLLDHGADIDALDVDHESTPAQWMIRDRQDVARYLVSRGCRTDLLMAVALGDESLARRHLDADPTLTRMSVTEEYFPKRDPRSGGTIYNWTLDRHKTVHWVARHFHRDDIYRLLIERSPDDVKLSIACEVGDDALLETLLARRPNLVNSLADDDKRMLAFAAQDSNTAVVRRMLKAGWPTDAGGQHGATALHWAAFHGNAEMTRDLLAHHARVDVLDPEYNGPPLGWAVYGSVNSWHCRDGDYAATVEALLQAGAKGPQVVDDSEGSEVVREVLRRYVKQ